MCPCDTKIWAHPPRPLPELAVQLRKAFSQVNVSNDHHERVSRGKGTIVSEGTKQVWEGRTADAGQSYPEGVKWQLQLDKKSHPWERCVRALVYVCVCACGCVYMRAHVGVHARVGMYACVWVCMRACARVGERGSAEGEGGR